VTHAGNFPSRKTTFNSTGLLALYTAFKALRKKVFTKSSDVIKMSDIVQLKYLITQYSSAPEAFAVHDTPVPFLLSSFIRASPYALVVHMIRSPARAWVLSRFRSGHGNHDIICSERFFAALDDPFDIISCLTLGNEHNLSFADTFMSMLHLNSTQPNLVVKAYEKYVWKVRKLVQPSHLFEFDLWRCAMLQNTTRCDTNAVLRPELTAFLKNVNNNSVLPMALPLT